MLDPKTTQAVLTQLDYWHGPLDGDLSSAEFRGALRRFQSDMALVADGIYGPKSDAVVTDYQHRLRSAPTGFTQARRWRRTSYWFAQESAYDPHGARVPIAGLDGRGTAAFVANAALEGTGQREGDEWGTGLINVTGRNVPVDPDAYQPVLDYARRQGWIPHHANLAGLVLGPDGRVKAASEFRAIPRAELVNGWPKQHNIPLAPWRTIAADIGVYGSSDPLFKGKGGVLPIGTKVWDVGLVGVHLPDGSVHDGWLTVNDTGGAIYGRHYDWFIGYYYYQQLVTGGLKPTDHTQLWSPGIETRIPDDHLYGL
jgi:peptidoglycan hydrolase-like protein with peptidoglycan-binding domain